MELRDLYYFEIIAEFQHVGRAAQYLHRSQPALTSCLRRLEEMAGGPLIQKTGRGITLTPAGKVLHIWARRLRLNARDAKIELSGVVQGVTGEVRMGFVPSAAQFLFPHITKKIFAEIPEVQLRTVVDIHENLSTMLREGEIDFMVVGESYKEPAFYARTIMEDVVVPVAIRTHPIFQAQHLSLNTLSEHDWILQPANVWPRQWLNQVFDRAGVTRPYVRIETNMLNFQPNLIIQSGLIGFLPRLQLATERQLKEIRVPRAIMKRRLELRYREGAYHSPVALRAIELLVDAGNIAAQLAREASSGE